MSKYLKLVPTPGVRAWRSQGTQRLRSCPLSPRPPGPSALTPSAGPGWDSQGDSWAVGDEGSQGMLPPHPSDTGFRGLFTQQVAGKGPSCLLSR